MELNDLWLPGQVQTNTLRVDKQRRLIISTPHCGTCPTEYSQKNPIWRSLGPNKYAVCFAGYTGCGRPLAEENAGCKWLRSCSGYLEKGCIEAGHPRAIGTLRWRGSVSAENETAMRRDERRQPDRAVYI